MIIQLIYGCHHLRLSFLFKTVCAYAKHKPMSEVTETFWDYLWDSVFLTGINSMWFLPTIFFGEIIFFILIRVPKIIKILAFTRKEKKPDCFIKIKERNYTDGRIIFRNLFKGEAIA